jgi:flagellin-like hook-associated protein FlgL
MSDIVLSPGVRQNLLALQDTANLLSITQNRLATGKKVNSALDNPANFFTSQALDTRATDLNALLDSIGQAQKTLEATDKGISALTKLVESAKSTALQARQAPLPGSTTYGPIAVAGTAQAEVLGTVTGLAAAPVLTANGNLVLTVNGVDRTIALANGDTLATVVNKINAVTGPTGTNEIVASADVTNHLVLTAANADADYTINNSSTAQILTDLGLTGGAAVPSTSLLDRIVAAGGTAGTSSLTIAVNGATAQTITFGTGPGEVSTQAELNIALSNIQNLTASVTGAVSSFVVGASSSQNNLTLTGSDAGVTTAIGVANGSTNGTLVTTTGNNALRTSLQDDYNKILLQIDALAKDASYNGINLLYGDDLKVVFNGDGSSTLTIAGVTFDSAGLQLAAITGTGFQSNSTIDTSIATLDTALSTLRSQAAKFGSSLTTVQIRQDFTKGLVTTLQTGADALVLADTNEEGANMLALQTRQQLSTTALSLSAQNDRAVLALFGG